MEICHSFRLAFIALLALIAPASIAQDLSGGLRDQLQQLGEEYNFRLSIVGHLEGPVVAVSDEPSLEAKIKMLIPKAHGFVLGYRADHSIASLTVFAADPSFHDGNDLPESELSQSVERQVGLQGDHVVQQLSQTLADRTAPEVRAKLAAIALLAEMDTDAGRKSLENGLGARDPAVRLAAIQAIERSRSSEAVYLLAQAYHVETHPELLRYLEAAFREIDHPLAVALR